ncbi:A-kinase anchor protein 10, mitochondrial isoform X1 [Neodiprion virginianus]|uniref:A-kinase anchor protein 10, mitochondrial isoform X1 n=1 Tax=Neodiprion virginianus TaxID=2961670 RepID=UPI001EE72C57|nr:A-kinase anchor protein 10, mitochondrial isoform X1 [Neodiprion virginianus]
MFVICSTRGRNAVAYPLKNLTTQISGKQFLRANNPWNCRMKRPRDKPGSSSKSENYGKLAVDVFRQEFRPLHCLEEEEEDEDCRDQKFEVTTFKSRLSKTLPEILSDKGALGYFFQFLEARGSVALIKFWLEVECVCNSHGVDEFEKCVKKGLGEAGDWTFIEENSATGSTDNNDNFRCNIAAGDIRAHDLVNSNHTKSNCDETPKTSQTVKRAQKSKNELIIKNHKTTAAEEDTLRIYKRYIANECLGLVQVPMDIRIGMESALHSHDIGLLLKCLSNVQQIVYKALEDEYINDFLRSDFHCKHQIDVLTSGDVQLADILYNETAFFHFMEFMEIEGKRELLDFWMSAVNYKQNLMQKGDSTNSAEAQTDALILYDKYFSLQATMPLGFSDKIRFHVEQNICREDGEGPRPECFDRPCQVVYRFLNKHYLGAFLSSQLYYKYLSELISSIQSSPCPPLHPQLRRTESDCSSDVSTVSIGTLSTTPISHEEGSGRKSGAKDTGSMSIDTRQLYDPDSLWKRQKYNLSVGYINDMGRFVTEIDPDPHRRYESRLSRAMKRLVNLENDKAKEEMAWRIAEMIVGEITSLTQSQRVCQTHNPS